MKDVWISLFHFVPLKNFADKMWSRGYPRDLVSSFLSSRTPKNGEKCLTIMLTNFFSFIERPNNNVF